MDTDETQRGEAGQPRGRAWSREIRNSKSEIRNKFEKMEILGNRYASALRRAQDLEPAETAKRAVLCFPTFENSFGFASARRRCPLGCLRQAISLRSVRISNFPATRLAI